MLYQFPRIIQAGIQAGKYVQVFSSSGVPLSIARDATTGQFVGNAVGMLSQNLPLNPLTVPVSLVSSGAQMYQVHRGFQAVQASLGVLQATTAVIGVGVAVTGILGAVNLYQTLKLRKAVERLELNVENGFIDLKQALADQGHEITSRIDEVAKDIKFEQHRVILIRAYGLFLQALDRISSALKIESEKLRNREIGEARGMLFDALADYNNQQLLENTCVAGKLRRLECSWIIEQSIIGTYQIQDEFDAVLERLSRLEERVRESTTKLIEISEPDEDLDFLFPEIVRIHDQDIALLQSWKEHISWQKLLPEADRKLLESNDFKSSEIAVLQEVEQSGNKKLYEKLELQLYEDLYERSINESIRDQLILLMSPSRRQNMKNYVVNHLQESDFNFLKESLLEDSSNFTLANLYWYFKLKEKKEEEE